MVYSSFSLLTLRLTLPVQFVLVALREITWALQAPSGSAKPCIQTIHCKGST
eukprot:m.97750 g.97750  ORF g.97750 m.97750 type:complete len:52 (+) comp14843_c0_seq1:2532-2687(+)